VTVLLDKRALMASLRNGQLRGPLGTIGQMHDLLAELVIASLLPETSQSLGDILLFHFFPLGSLGRRQAGCGEP